MCPPCRENDVPLGAMRRGLRAQNSVEIIENDEIARSSRAFEKNIDFGH
jgi:hypothetical protein